MVWQGAGPSWPGNHGSPSKWPRSMAARAGDCLLKPQWIRKGQTGREVCCQEPSSRAVAGLEAIPADSKNCCCPLEFPLCNNSYDISPPPHIFIQCVREILRSHLNLMGPHIHGWQLDDFSFSYTVLICRIYTGTCFITSSVVSRRPQTPKSLPW